MNLERIEWCDIWVEQANQDLLPRVLLIGDSITRSYFDRVSKALDRIASCARLASSRCIGDPILMDELSLLLKQFPFDLVQFNNGLHGMNNSEELYRDHFEEVLSLIRTLAPNATLIWACSTPWRRKENLREFHPNNEKVLARNKIAQAYARDHAIPINDLYAVLVDHPEYTAEDGIHLTESGRQVVAEQTLQILLPMMKPAAG